MGALHCTPARGRRRVALGGGRGGIVEHGGRAVEVTAGAVRWPWPPVNQSDATNSFVVCFVFFSVQRA